MIKVKLTITESKCRSGYFKKGQEFIVEDLCRHCVMSYGIICTHLFMHSKMEQN